MKDIKHLDESITQYEEMHARQDLQAFKELLDATKSLLAEHSSRNRSLESYQSGTFGKLPSVQRFMVAYEQVTAQLNNRMGIIQAALERDQVRMEALHAEERTKQGLMNLVFGVLTVVAGVSALVMSGGTALPIVAPMLKIAGVGMYLLGSSNSFEGVQNIILGSIGDGKTVAFNPVRDTIFFGKAELYNQVRQVFSLTTGVFLPITQTQRIAQGISQFLWGTIGGLATGQVAYHGTKLLGGNEETAQLMNLLGNFVGGYKFSKVAENFNLNKNDVNITTANETNIFKSNLSHKETINSDSLTKNHTSTVGRWMSVDEYNKMLDSGKVQMSPNGNTTYVATPSNIDLFPSAKTGSIFTEFDVDSKNIYPAGKEGWGQIPGPGSLIDRLNQKKGLPAITEMPDALNIIIKGEK